MRREYRYKTNILIKVLPIFWFLLVCIGFIYSMIIFIPQAAFSYILIDLVIMVFFIFVFRHVFRLYFLSVPLLIVDELCLTVCTLYGIKIIKYEDVVSISVKHKTSIGSNIMTIDSKINSPIKISINQLDDTQENVEKYVLGLYNSYKLSCEVNEKNDN